MLGDGRRDRGFSMLEVIVALVVLGVGMAALAPQMIAFTQAGARAKLLGQAKGLAQGQLEAMRALPFQVSSTAGNHRDLLDLYYRNLVPPAVGATCRTADGPVVPAPSWSGWVSAAAPRCGYEPAAGAFYRRVIAAGEQQVPAGFTLVVDTAFLSAAVPGGVLVPAAGYDSQTPGRDRGPSSQVAVTATVIYRAAGGWVPYTVGTQMAARTPTETRIGLQARATAVEVASVDDDGQALSLTGGQLALSGSLAHASQAAATLSAIGGAGSVAGRRVGAQVLAQAPYVNTAHTTAAAGGLSGDCTGPCWASTAVTGFTATGEGGLPRVGGGGPGWSVVPVQTVLADNTTRNGFSFPAAATLPDLTGPPVALDAAPPADTVITNLAEGLFGCAFRSPGPLSHLSGAGFLTSTDAATLGNPLSVEACAGARTNVIRLLPTALAPHGLVRITARTSARCTVTGAAHTPAVSAEYRAEVEYWAWTPATVDAAGQYRPGHGSYRSAGVITPATTTDPLAAVPLTSPVSDAHTLGDYLESWTGLSAAAVQTTTTAQTATLSIPALVSLQTKPLRGEDPASAVTVAIGAASCHAEDHR